MSSPASTKTTVVVGAMHRAEEGAMFSICVHCGAMAEELSKPCKAYLGEAAELKAALEQK